ncbi:MAG: glycoside hydrolase family 1 protein [Chloroflexota bacterium]
MEQQITRTLSFPDGFLWGTATSAHQVEGHNPHNDWWEWEQQPGRIAGGGRAQVACDWWHRAEEDFDRAAALGQNSHRLSIAWSRLEPAEGQWDAAAEARYREMLAALRARGLEPMVTLHHFTSPRWLAEDGGWANPAAVARFTRFARRAAAAFGDLVTLWCTINEPVIYAFNTCLGAIFPPGQVSVGRTLRTLRHMACAHAAAYQAIHEVQPQARVGLVKHQRAFAPANPVSALDGWAAGVRDYLLNRLFMAAVMEGRWLFPLGWGQRDATLPGRVDFLGLNYYNSDAIAFDLAAPQNLFAREVRRPNRPPDLPHWWGDPDPDGLYRFLKQFGDYGLPIYVTENGWLDATDEERPYHLVTHLAAVQRAITEGAPVKGYYHWSLLDNFEWAEGFSARFGLIAVDFETQARAVRRSGELYAEICRAGAVTPEMVARYVPRLAVGSETQVTTHSAG